ncbi:MAG: hypothetical protein ILP18_05100 [Treponema sp.]|nr:hypothetical protein [Treponema sp.]
MNKEFVGLDARFAKGFARCVVFLCLLFLPLAPFHAARKAGDSKETSIPIPQGAKARGSYYFSNIKPRILDLIENGSPRSLQVAVRLLHRSDPAAYSDSEKTLLKICGLLMEFCWPSYMAGSWDIPEMRGSNSYTNVIFNVRNGLYEAPAGDDFIANLLPCVCLFSAPNETACYASMEAALEKALKLRGDSTLANYMMGILLNRQGKNARAASCLRKASAGDSSNKEILFLQMRVCSSLGKYEETLKIGERLLLSEPKNVEALKLCCDAYYAKGDLAKAGDLAAQILMLDGRSYGYMLIRSEASMAEGDYVKASTMLDAYSRSGNRSKEYFFLRSRLQCEWNKSPAAAAETLGQAMLNYPDDIQLMLSAAKVASEGNMKVAGKTALEFAHQVLKKESGNREAKKVCIVELSKDGDYEESYKLSSSLVKEDGSPSLLHSHIETCLALKKYDEARELATSLYNKDRNDIQAQKSYINVLVSTGIKREAQDMISALLPDADSSMKSFLYYEQSFLATDERSAVALLRSSLTQNPRNTDSLTRLYEIYYGQQDWKRAQYYLKQVVALNPTNKKALAMSQKLDKIINN